MRMCNAISTESKLTITSVKTKVTRCNEILIIKVIYISSICACKESTEKHLFHFKDIIKAFRNLTVKWLYNLNDLSIFAITTSKNVGRIYNSLKNKQQPLILNPNKTGELIFRNEIIRYLRY